MTAEVLAAENDVSVRTIYRDIDALRSQGVPATANEALMAGIAFLMVIGVRLNGLTPSEAEAISCRVFPALPQISAWGR